MEDLFARTPVPRSGWMPDLMDGQRSHGAWEETGSEPPSRLVGTFPG